MTATVSMVGAGLMFDVVTPPGVEATPVEPVVQTLALTGAAAAVAGPAEGATAPVEPTADASPDGKPAEPEPVASVPVASTPAETPAQAPEDEAPADVPAEQDAADEAPAEPSVAPSAPGLFAPPAEGRLLTDVVEADQDFSMVGVTWDADAEAGTDVRVEVRVREGDGWSDWVLLELNDAGPDDGTEEAALAADVISTEPLVTDTADAVQVRVQADGEVPDDLSAVVIDPGTSPADAVETSDAPLSAADASIARPAVVTRAQWGAVESQRRCNPSYSSRVVAAGVHHTAGSNTYSASQGAAVVRGIYAYHTGSLGWCDIGYNFLVDKYGKVYEGRYGGMDRAVRGAHSGGFNDRTFGVAALGNYQTASAPTAMVSAIGRIIGWKLGVHGASATAKVTLTSAGGGTSRYPSGRSVTQDAIFAHSDVGYTACPGTNLRARLGTIRSTAALWTVGDMKGNLVTPVRYPGAPRTDLLTYDRGNGARFVFGQRGNALLDPKTRSTWSKGWTHLVEAEVDGSSGTEVVAYDRSTGRVVVLDVRADGSTPTLLTTQWSAGWTDVVAVETDGTTRSELVVYNRSTGRQLVIEIDLGRKLTRTLTQSQWSRSWTHLSGMTVGGKPGSAMSVYNRSTGRHLVLGVSGNRFSRTLSESAFSPGWDVVRPLEVDTTSRSELLTYKSSNGRMVLSDLGSTGRTSTMTISSWSPGWTDIMVVSVDGTAGDEVLTYNASSGRMVTTDLDRAGRPRTIG
ncbi:N-acetylmuramoyl-L-alanine amidase [Jannaschia sp. R86511]|uniref:N-acetylmuramoyl-L-alanine amidase n=1 Tax=Jannaschia sp. R86511 TaxID=3093853 RepID=UPI0036D35FF9